MKKETPTLALSYEFCEIFRNLLFTDHLQTTASETVLSSSRNVKVNLWGNVVDIGLIHLFLCKHNGCLYIKTRNKFQHSLCKHTYKQVEINDTFTKKAVVKLNILGGGILAVASWVLGLPWQCSFEFFIWITSYYSKNAILEYLSFLILKNFSSIRNTNYPGIEFFAILLKLYSFITRMFSK